MRNNGGDNDCGVKKYDNGHQGVQKHDMVIKVFKSIIMVIKVFKSIILVIKVFKSMDLVQSYPSLFQVLWYSINPCFDIRWNLVWFTLHLTNTIQCHLRDLHSQLTSSWPSKWFKWLFYSGKDNIHAVTLNQFQVHGKDSIRDWTSTYRDQKSTIKRCKWKV